MSGTVVHPEVFKRLVREGVIDRHGRRLPLPERQPLSIRYPRQRRHWR